jgi:hypothetical protein
MAAMPSPMPRRLFDICFVPGLPAFASGRSDNPASPGPAGTSPVLGSGRGGRCRGSFPSAGSVAVNFLSGACRSLPWLRAWYVSGPMGVLLAMIISFHCLALGLALKTHPVVKTFRFSWGGSITTKDYLTLRAHADRSQGPLPAQSRLPARNPLPLATLARHSVPTRGRNLRNPGRWQVAGSGWRRRMPILQGGFGLVRTHAGFPPLGSRRQGVAC